jgi:hypothetical protein
MEDDGNIFNALNFHSTESSQFESRFRGSEK